MLRQADKDLLTKTSKSTKLMLQTELKNEIREILKIIKKLNLHSSRLNLVKMLYRIKVMLKVPQTSILRRIHTSNSIQTRQA